MTYCKIIKGRIVFPQKIYIEDSVVYSPTEEQLKSQGWKQLITSIPPEVEENYHAEAIYFDTGDYILQNWIVVKDTVKDTEE